MWFHITPLLNFIVFFFIIAPLLNFTAFGDFDNQIETSMQSIVHLYKHHENERESQKRLLCDPDLIHNYFLLLKRMFDFFNNRNKCHKPGFLRGNIYTSCISMVLLDHFANKSNTFQLTLSLPLLLSHFLPFPPWVSSSSNPGSQDRAINGILVFWWRFL